MSQFREVRPQVPESFEGRREVDLGELGMARLGRQNEMVRPIADLFIKLIKAGKITETELQETLREAYKPIGSYAEPTGQKPSGAETASDMTSARFLAILGLRLSGGDVEKMTKMIGSNWVAGSEPISPYVEQIAKKLNDPKTRSRIGS